MPRFRYLFAPRSSSGMMLSVSTGIEISELR